MTKFIFSYNKTSHKFLWYEKENYCGQFNHGLSGGYSYVMLFGRTDKNNMFTPNNFGLAASTGFIFAYDRQKRYDTTFDFLWKLGLEAGYQHTMGVELDFLLGSGKTCGDYIFTTNDENNPEMTIPYTNWCLKYGFQISLRSNILRTQIKNTDVRLFARYVYSKNPENDQELWKNGIDCRWQEESWSFGLTFCYGLLLRLC